MSRLVTVTTLVLASIVAWRTDARASERLAVVIVVDDDAAAGDRALSDNLTEIAIAELAEGHDRELVGARELRATPLEAPGDGGLAGCLAQAACLASVGRRVGAQRAVVGFVRRQPASYALAIALVDTRSGARGAEVKRLVPLDLAALIAAVRDTVSELSEPSPPPLTPSPAPPPARTDKVKAGPSLAAITSYGAAGLAVVAFSAGAVTGAIANEPPSGATRVEKQMDLSSRMQDAKLANAFLLTGLVLTGLAAAALIWHWQH